jgi:integration host factor subunit beta
MDNLIFKVRLQVPLPDEVSLATRGRTKMNKSELIEALAERINLPIREAGSITNTLIDTMTEALANGESIEIRGFGSFVVKEYESYTGRNPKTGQKIKVSPKKLPFFKVGKELRERVNNQAGSKKKGRK